MRRDVERQRDFAEALLPEELGRDEVLARVDGLVDWAVLERVCGEVQAAPVGRPSCPLVVLIKAMLVQAWWNLSDPKAEPLLWNDRRFRRFLGVGLVGKTPDRNTLWRFDAWALPAARDELAKRGLAEALFAEVDRQLRARGLVLRRGRIVDATLVRSAVSSNNRRKDGRPVIRTPTGRRGADGIQRSAASGTRPWTGTPASCGGSRSRRPRATSGPWRRRSCRMMSAGCGRMRRTM